MLSTESIGIKIQNHLWPLVGVIVLWLVLGLLIWGCMDKKTGVAKAPEATPRIADTASFDHLLASAGERLLVIEFFADWCAPCKLLAPILVEVAEEVKDLADVYTIDVDANRRLAQRMGVSGIPNILLIKNGKTLDRLRGLLPKETYLTAIRRAAG